MRLSIIVFIAACLSFSCLIAGAQSAPRYSFDNFRPLTPSAYSFFKYVDNPTDLYHGIPSVSVPIYNFELEGKAFPIEVTYHAGGIRVTEEASWVGLGWDLQVPAIVQSINDENDFDVNPNRLVARRKPDWPGSPQPANFPFRYRYPDLYNGYAWFSPYPSSGMPANPTADHVYKICYDYFIPVNGNFDTQQDVLFAGENDSEPDIFKLNLFGKLITFKQHSSGSTIEVLNNPQFKVVPVPVSSGMIQTWRVTDGDGYQYEFSQPQVATTSVTSHDIVAPGGSSGVPSTITWSITSIISPSGQRVTFNYASALPERATNHYADKYQTSTLQGQQNVLLPIEAYVNVPNSTLNPNGIFTTTSETYERKRYLSAISYKNLSVNFYTSNRDDLSKAKKLDKVEVTDTRSGEVFKKIDFQFDYFVSSANLGSGFAGSSDDDCTKRLRLRSIINLDAGRYSFGYDAEPLPSRNSFAQDFWGYYNGANTNSSLIPNASRLRENTTHYPNVANNNSARLAYARAGTLTQIVYPTGGSKTFEYELNQFANCWVPDYDSTSNTISSGNGLRVKRIHSQAGTNAPRLTEEYDYLGGKTMLPLSFSRTITYNQTDGNAVQGAVNLRQYDIHEIKNGGQYSPALLGSGTGVGYSIVRTRRIDNTAANGVDRAGTTVHYFANYADENTIDSNLRNPNATLAALSIMLPAFQVLTTPQNTLARQNGTVDSVYYYDNANVVVKKITYQYDAYCRIVDYGARIFSSGYYWYGIVPTGSGVIIAQYKSKNHVGFYPLVDKLTLKKSETTTLFTPGISPFRTTTAYEYDDHNNVTSVRTTNSGTAGYRVQLYSYPSPIGNAQEIALRDANRINQPVRYEDQRTGTTVYRYRKLYKAHRTGQVLDSVIVEERANRGTARVRRHAYDVYDYDGRCLQSTVKPDGPTAFIWNSYLNQLLAEVRHATPDQIAYTSFEPDAEGKWQWSLTSAVDTGGVTGSHCLRLWYQLTSPSLPAGTYRLTYWAKGVVPHLTVSGPPVGYSVASKQISARPGGWVQYQANIVLLATPNATHVLYFDDDASHQGRIDEVRLCPVGARMTSYTRSTEGEITSQTDANGRIASFEYDAAWRLQRIRDEQKRILSQQEYQFSNK